MSRGPVRVREDRKDYFWTEVYGSNARGELTVYDVTSNGDVWRCTCRKRTGCDHIAACRGLWRKRRR